MALAEPAGLAAFPHVHVNLAVAAKLALIVQRPRDRTAEEALAALAGENVVVPARGLVSTDHTHLHTLANLPVIVQHLQFQHLH